MPENIAVALISGILAVLGSYMGNVAVASKKSREEATKDAEREQAQKDRLDSISDWMEKVDKKLDEHNGYAEKFANSEKAMMAIQKDVEYMKRDISEIKERSK